MQNFFRGLVVILGVAAVVACSDGNDIVLAPGEPPSFDALGPYPVATRTLTIMNNALGRTLTVELWYPAQGSNELQAIQDFAADAQEADALNTLLSDNPDNCVRQETSSSRGLPAATTPTMLPLVVFSHCHECVRYSSYSMAERLASHGFAVAAPDHLMNTLFNAGAMLSGEFLNVRASDIAAVADELLVPNSAVLPEDLQGRFDANRLGMAGHSFGAVTAGKVLQDDDRFKAGFFMAAPVENPLIPGVMVEQIDEPTLYLVAGEDNSIGELGNILMRANFDAAASPSWKIEVADAGHWSFSDIAGITPGFSAGCGDGERQTAPGESFSYLEPQLGREITSAYAVRFFAAHLLANDQALAELGTTTEPDTVDIQVK